MQINYHILNDSIIVNYSGKVIKVKKDSVRGQKVIELIQADKLDEIPMLIDAELRIKRFSQDKFAIEDGVVYSYGEPVHPIITEKIIQFYNNNLPFDYLLNFWNNLKENPSKDSQAALYDFMVAGEFPLTPDGYFIAYKRVSKSFKDLYSGTIDNSIGATPEMDRSLVDANRSNTCSSGLHVAAYEYAKNTYYSGDPNTLLIEVKVNPRDVVMVPTDYNHQKGRVCKYEVIDVIDQKHSVIILDDDKYVSDEYVVSDEVSEPPTSNIVIGDDDNCSTGTLFNKDVKIGNDQYKSAPIDDNIPDRIKSGGYVHRKPSKIPSAILRAFFDIDMECRQLYTRDDVLIGKVYLAEYTDNTDVQWVVFRKK